MSSARIGGAWATCAALAVFSFATSRAAAGDLIVTGAKPDRLFIIDAPTRSVRSEIHIPGANDLVSVILIVGALTFFPALSLGPILEHLLMNAGKAF